MTRPLPSADLRRGEASIAQSRVLLALGECVATVRAKLGPGWLAYDHILVHITYPCAAKVGFTGEAVICKSIKKRVAAQVPAMVRRPKPQDGTEAERTMVDRRYELLTLGANPERQKGLEFGALNNPIVKKGSGDIRFVDYASTAHLRAYPHADTVIKDAIVEVDYIWYGSGSLADAIGTGEQFDYAIASHVIEHVPNVLGWFRNISRVLRIGGVFNLAVPDKRYTFDYKRNLSTIGELVEAYLLNFSHPSVRQMFDHCYGARAIEPGTPWDPKTDAENAPRLCGDVALDLALHQSRHIVETGHYYDSHCTIVTPSSFLDLLEEASLLRLFPMVLTAFRDTQPGGFEFFTQFTKLDSPEMKQMQIDAIKRYRASLTQPTVYAECRKP
jgi:SAM-dependent methyltransferase